MVDARRFVGRANASIDDSPGERIDLLIGRDTLRYDASCNEVDVAYALIDGVLYLGDVMRSTAVGCFPEVDKNAPHVGPLLDSLPTFSLEGDALTIRSSFGELQLIDATAPHPDDVPLVGTEWSLRLVVVQDNGGFMSLEEPTPVARFTADAVELTFRCRTADLAAMVDLDGGTITFAPAEGGRSGLLGSPPVTPVTSVPADPAPPTTLTPPTIAATLPMPQTTMPPPCDPNTPTELEQRVVATLIGALTFEIDIDELHLRTTDRSGLDLIAPLPPLRG
jgi:hypothetical protein